MAVKQRSAKEDPVLKVKRRYLLLVFLCIPLLLAFYGFFVKQKVQPTFPSLPQEMPERGRIMTRNGTIFAEGPAEHRKYPQGVLAAHLIGFSGKPQNDGRYGLEGLEYTLDETLQKQTDVILTIDPNIQAIAQNHLREAAQKFQAANGSVVILEAGTGRILAAASYPEYDPNTQSKVKNRDVINNKAFLNQYEPGSVMKPFVIAALLERGNLNLNEYIDAPMMLRVGEKTFQDVVNHDPKLTPWDILRYSSNSGMIHLSERLSDQDLYDWLDHFGFGREMNIPFTFTRPGQLNSPIVNRWYPQDHASITIGGGISTTTLQLAAAYSIFANDGLYLPPYLVENGPKAEAKRLLSATTATIIRSMLQYVIQQGTLNQMMLPALNIAGKTGTADYYDEGQGKYIDDEYTISFAGMFPADKPKVVIVVSVQKPQIAKMSTTVAAPLFASISQDVAALLEPQ
jgi:cell division protein FtsI (penicillin-binding protein 3)